jgi:plasmid stabilization system protein ParE
MASKPVRLHPEAEREYLEALGWYRDRSAVVASDFERAVSKAVQAIEALRSVGRITLENSGGTRCIGFRSASSIRKCFRRLLFSRSLMGGGCQGTGENEPKFEFEAVDASLIPPRPRKY